MQKHIKSHSYTSDFNAYYLQYIHKSVVCDFQSTTDETVKGHTERFCTEIFEYSLSKILLQQLKSCVYIFGILKFTDVKNAFSKPNILRMSKYILKEKMDNKCFCVI